MNSKRNLLEVDSLYAQAIELPETERQAFLDQACENIAGPVREEVEKLLRAGERAMADPSPGDFEQTVLPEGATSGDPVMPARIGRYRVDRLLGEGGFGRVYLAHDEKLRRSVAIKVPSRAFDSANAELYLSEARMLAGLDHPNIVPVYDVGSSDEHPCFIVSKWIEGTDLAENLSQHRPSFSKSATLIRTVAEALNYAHSRKIIHRDIKPGNILIDTDGKPYVADFGVALSEQAFGKPTGIVGTFSHMSPEQARGEGHLVDGRSDIFSLGVVLYRLLTNEQPFTGADRAEMVERITRQDPRPPRQLNPEVPKELERICLKALAKRASDRYSTGQDLAEDLRCWLDESPTSDRQQASQQASAVVSVEATSSSQNAGVVPKGLRCFDRQDADFFLALVPGPRDRHGWPDSIRHWKGWTEQAGADDAHRVGVVYGPSGCGKSSLIRAGFLPLLSSTVRQIVIDASPQQTEARLLKQLRAQFEFLSAQLNLSQSLAEIRRTAQRTPGHKLLIVIDQFEQWLHSQADYETSELLFALRQCDGVTIQCLLLVRDDFFLGLSRFMSMLEIPLTQGNNMMLVDLFDPSHARKVLMMFGRAFDRLRRSPNDLTQDQEQFVSRSIESLESGGKIFPVRLALFTEMVKGREWIPATVTGMGGAAGVGVAFLEEAFSSEHAPANQRLHEKAARGVLESLLPEAGSPLKGHRRTREELMTASGYSDQPKRFDDLLEILDFQLRLISPTEIADVSRDRAPHPIYYQLSHDYLVPSVREWITRRQRQSLVGRIELQFADRTSLWALMPEKRLLPTWWEWIKFQVYLPRQRWSAQQRAMMRAANRRFLTYSALFALAALLLTWGTVWASREVRARSLTDQLATAQLSQIPDLISKLKPYRSHAQQRLREQMESSPDAGVKLASALALVEWNDSAVDELCRQALSCDPESMRLIGEALAPYGEEIAERFWLVLEDNDADPAKRFRSAQLLARLAPPVGEDLVKRWQPLAEFSAQQLVQKAIAQPQDFGALADLLQPASDILIEPLKTALGSVEQTAQAATRTSLLLRYTKDSPGRLTRITLDTAPWQLELAHPLLLQHKAEEIVPLLLEAAQQLPDESRTSERHDQLARRAATAGALLVALKRGDDVWHLLSRSPRPDVRSYLIHRFLLAGAPLDALVQRAQSEQDPAILAALLMAIGQYEVPNSVRKAFLPQLRTVYQSGEDPGLHGAAEWLLRRWNDQETISQLVNNAQPSGSKPWRVNEEGHTLIRIDGRQDPNIGRIFEIATLEVSVEQYRRFEKYKYFNKDISPTTDCPMNIVKWSDAIAYCNWLTEREGSGQSCYRSTEDRDGWIAIPGHLRKTGYRLPTQVEWEMACLAGTSTARYFGEKEELLAEYVWYELNSGERAWPRGLKKPNDDGLFDMIGNVSEWCDDQDGPERVLCGSSYRGDAADQISLRHGKFPGWTEYNSFGFRIARTLADDESDPSGAAAGEAP